MVPAGLRKWARLRERAGFLEPGGLPAQPRPRGGADDLRRRRDLGCGRWWSLALAPLMTASGSSTLRATGPVHESARRDVERRRADG